MIERFLDGLREKMEDPVDCTWMSVVIPGDVDPIERHYRYTIHLDAELRLAGMGCSQGGGTLFFDPDDEDGDGDGSGDGEPEICFCIMDVEATDVDGAREVIRRHMPELGVPPGTLVQWGEFEDRFDGEAWLLCQPRSLDEFDL